jgi:hypothetical protein
MHHYRKNVSMVEPSGNDILTSVWDRDLVKTLGSVRDRVIGIGIENGFGIFRDLLLFETTGI